MSATNEKTFDSLNFIMAYEDGQLDEEAIVEGFQCMIDSGICWKLQGSYGRMANRLIEAGYCHECEGK